MENAVSEPDPDQQGQSERFRLALEAFDRANAADPTLECVEGRDVPKELIYGQRMSAWLDRLCPQASEALRLAARCQHIERWVRPRTTYPEGRIGYLTWRRDLKRYHAERAGEILSDLGYPKNLVARVQALVRKERLKQDDEAQVLEDVACLVFLAHYLADFADKHRSDKLAEILRKTWSKMSPRARRAALALPLEGGLKALLGRALSEPPAGEEAGARS